MTIGRGARSQIDLKGPPASFLWQRSGKFATAFWMESVEIVGTVYEPPFARSIVEARLGCPNEQTTFVGFVREFDDALDLRLGEHLRPRWKWSGRRFLRDKTGDILARLFVRCPGLLVEIAATQPRERTSGAAPPYYPARQPSAADVLQRGGLRRLRGTDGRVVQEGAGRGMELMPSQERTVPYFLAWPALSRT